MTSCAAIIVAAGRGKRFGGETPKQYRALAGESVLRRTLRAFATHPQVDRVIAVIDPAEADTFTEAARGLRVAGWTAGGAERQDSVRNGLAFLAESGAPDLVLIHDGARPLVSARLISDIIAALADHAGAVPALAVADTLKRGRDGAVVETVDRTGLFGVQTPQGFRYADLMAAHAKAKGQALTDDAAVAEAAGLSVALVPGDADNFKITQADDLARAERVLASRAPQGEIRTGMGFDVHRFEPGTAVRLGGVDIPYHLKLAGHSDADVALHALTDALLGTVGGGDIGKHFPPTDPQWKGADSHIFLAAAGEAVRAKGGAIVNLDLTVICEAPKVGPHRDAIARRIAEILGISIDRVNVKATTTERLGFTGRGEGIAAQAIANVRLPTFGE